MSTFTDLISNLTVAAASGPDRDVAREFIDPLRDASQRAADLTAAANAATAAVADWSRGVRALEVLTAGSSGPPFDSTNIAAAQQRTSSVIARAKAAQVAPQLIDAVTYKPGPYFAATRAGEQAVIASSDLAALMASAQQSLTWLAIA